MLIEIEGIDGAGKTTQCRLLEKELQNNGVQCISVREPGGTDVGNRIKQFIMDEDGQLTGGSQTFLFLASKHELYQSIILPAFAQGKWVISDRGGFSFLSFHLVNSQFNRTTLQHLLNEATEHTQPVLRVILDVDPELAEERLKNRPDKSKFDMMGIEFFNKQRDLFRSLAAQDAGRSRVINASRPVEDVHQEILHAIKPFYKLS